MIARRILRSMAAVLTAGALATIAAAGCGSNDAIVGGACAEGLIDCRGHCVDTSRDPNNCGTCGNACLPPLGCMEGQCATTSSSDGSADAEEDVAVEDAADALADAEEEEPAEGDGAVDSSSPDAGDGSGADAADATLDAGETDGSDATVSDGAMSASDADATVTDGESFDADGDVTVTDGESFEAGEGGAATDAENDGAENDTGPICAPLTDCSGTCVDTTSDGENCGACGRRCPSLICSASLCVGATAGSFVFVGHDYETTTPNTVQARVLSNAVYLWTDNSVPVLSYEQYASPTALTNIQNILQSAAVNSARPITVTHSTNDADIPSTLSTATYGVLLVADQAFATGVDLGAVGASWASTLATFTQDGGIVVVLDGGTGSAQMPAFASAMGLLSVTADSVLPVDTNVTVLAPADSMSVGLLSPYRAGRSSVTITTEPNGGAVSYVVGLPSDAGASPSPVVVHKVF